MVKQYKFVDFDTLITIQGIVIKEKSDDLNVSIYERELRIRGAAGLNIAPRVYKKKKATSEGQQKALKFKHFIGSNKAILDMRRIIADKRSFNTYRRDLRTRIISSDDKNEILAGYKELIIFYITHGLYKEATILMEVMEGVDPLVSQKYDVKLLKTAALFMQYRYMEAYQVAKSINILDVPRLLRKEVRFWKAVSAYMTFNSGHVFNKINPVKFLSRHTSSFFV